MSTALAIAGVSAVLQTFLGNVYSGLSSIFGSNVTVSSKAPDIVQESFSNQVSGQNQVNLFLHQVTHNPSWRNQDFPSLDTDGRTRLTNPFLALDLHYLLTAYGSEDWQAEALLGLAVLMLHENPVLTRNDISQALSSLSPSNTLSPSLAVSGIADQIEMLKITPATLGREEMAWLWTALKADYRPTFSFQVSVVLMQSKNTGVSALPVLQRNITVQPNLLSPLPTLISANAPNGQPAAVLGDTVTIQGANLTGAAAVLLSYAMRGIQQSITTLLNVTDTSFQFNLPKLNLPTDLPAGIYDLSAQVLVGADLLTTNSVPFAIAPQLNPGTVPASLVSGPSVQVKIGCTPFLRPGQQGFLLIGGQQAPADDFTGATGTPSFTFQPLQPTGGAVPVRLRVDGIDSPAIDMTQSPPAYSAPMTTVT